MERMERLIAIHAGLTLLIWIALAILDLRTCTQTESLFDKVSPCQPHIAPKGGRPEDAPLHPGGQARRWVVERTHAWFDRFRRLVVNWEKTTESRYAFLCLASALMAYRL